jgi:hypothetical protein
MGWVRCALLRFEIHHGSEQMNTDEHGWMTTSVFIRHILSIRGLFQSYGAKPACAGWRVPSG